MRLPVGGRIKKLGENTLLSQDGITPLANYYQVANNCMVYPTICLHFHFKQTRHWRNIVSFYFFLFVCGRAKCLSREQSVGSE